jgi:magnesium chelatase subunit D
VAPPGDEPDRITRLEAPRTTADAGGRRSMVEGARGRLVGDRPPAGALQAVAVGATIRAAAARRASDPGSGQLVAPADLREAVKEQRAGNLVILAVDASGSMGAETRMEAAKAAVLGLLLDAYQRRDRVALVTFRGDGAEVVLRPTGSVEVARARLTELPTGGRTPLASGIHAALTLAQHPADRPLLVLVSDGRATAGPDGQDPLVAAKEAAAEVRRRKVPAVVVDAEDGHTRLGLAAELAEAMGARYLTLPQLTAASVRQLAGD